MTVFADETVRSQVALEISTRGFVKPQIASRHSTEAVRELQVLCPAADLVYLWAGDSMIVDKNWWRAPHENWEKFGIAHSSDNTLSPADYEIPRT